MPSSPIDPAIGHLVDLGEHIAADRPGLLAVLGQVADPRRPRGVRHSLACVLTPALCAVLAGARSFIAIAEWAADAGEEVMAEVDARRDPPSESPFRRTLPRVDGEDLDRRLGRWAQARTGKPDRSRRGVAVDGKTVRSSATPQRAGRVLMAALDHTSGLALGQVEIG